MEKRELRLTMDEGAEMHWEFPAAVPEIPVSNVDKAAEYYAEELGFSIDWGGEDGGIAGLSRGSCRIFLTNPSFREMYGNLGPVMVWLNLNSKTEVKELYEEWEKRRVRIISEPEEKAWKLLEFTAADPDGNLFRVFYDFSREV